jgi:16S rRNA (guanine(1405)-N(7))-methyltransferase
MAEIDVDAVVGAVAESKRYRHVARSVVARLAGEELPKSRNAAEAEKRTKRRLHQIFGAYATQLPYDRLLAELSAARGDAESFERACAKVLQQHASTAERLPDLHRFYAPIFGITGTPGTVLDVACGLNPLTIPWMGLGAGARYLAADIDVEMVRFLDGFLKLAGIEGGATVNDLVAGPPAGRADVAFLFKTLPCLQHQTDRLLEVLDAVRADWLVVSFPTRSLGRREKGMAGTYRAMYLDLIRPRAWETRELTLGSELVFVTRK